MLGILLLSDNCLLKVVNTLKKLQLPKMMIITYRVSKEYNIRKLHF